MMNYEFFKEVAAECWTDGIMLPLIKDGLYIYSQYFIVIDNL